MRVGLLHPGQMGVSVGAAAMAAGAEVLWASKGRSPSTRERAESARFGDAGDLSALLGASEVVLSVCPPHSALDLAGSVAKVGFTGLYVDANAIAPETSRTIERVIAGAGASYVDGGIIGPPAREAGSTRLYLSGPRAPEVAALFAGSILGAEVIGGPPGRASALKMAYAAWTKGSDALLLAIRSFALAEGVEDALLPGVGALPGRSRRAIGAVRADRGASMAIRRRDAPDRASPWGRRLARGLPSRCRQRLSAPARLQGSGPCPADGGDTRRPPVDGRGHFTP